MKANRQRLLTTISVVVDCWDRARGPADFHLQVARHIGDLRQILNDEWTAIHNKPQVPAKNRIRRVEQTQDIFDHGREVLANAMKKGTGL